MGNKIHNAKFKASPKSGVCCKCKKTFKSEELQYYIDGCNYAITNNSKPICIYCKPPKYIDMGRYKDMNSYLAEYGIKFDDSGKFRNELCTIEIVRDMYFYINIWEKEGAFYSSDLNIYWLIGLVRFYNLIEDTTINANLKKAFMAGSDKSNWTKVKLTGVISGDDFTLEPIFEEWYKK